MWKIIGNIGKLGCIVIFFNQLCFKIGVIYGNLEIIIGGNVFKFYVLVCFDICWIQIFKKGIEEFGIRVKVKVVKNKVVLFFCIVEFDIFFGCGISILGCLLDLVEEMGVVVCKGVWYSYEGDNIGQGCDNIIFWMEENLDVIVMIEMLVCQKLIEGFEVKVNLMCFFVVVVKMVVVDKLVLVKVLEVVV